MKKAIVTGADGFVGSYLVKELLENGYMVYAIGLKENPKRIISVPNFVYISKDVNHVDELYAFFVEKNVDYFFHLAWRGSAGEERNDEKIQLANALTTSNCLRFAKKINCTRFIVSGTIMEFETNSVIYSEGTKPKPSYIYGAGKVAAHQICKPIANSIGIGLQWVYITNAYGIGEISPRFINTTIKKIIDDKELQFSSGTQNYDFVYITDVATAFRLIAEKGVANKSYMIGSGNAKPLKEFVLELVSALDTVKKPVFGDIPYTGTNLPLATYSIDDLIHDCGFSPKVGFSEGVQRTYQFLKEQQDD